VLTEDLHHLTFLTADLDRLIAFYERVFEAQVALVREDGGRRHAFIEVGPHTVLHPFEVPADESRDGSRSSSAAASTTSPSTPRARRRSARFAGG
jgi:catechol 2,3-dioxygenase-like lactoylglutathione lyase family enzyme